MAPTLLLTDPAATVAGPSADHLRLLVAADALVRHAAGAGHRLPWRSAVLPGGLAGQWRIEDDLRRDGLDKGVLGQDAFVARLEALTAEAARRLSEITAALGIELDVQGAVAAGGVAARAARTAFVRLYEAGLITEEERVVDVCPRCASVVPAAEVLPAELPGELLTIRVALRSSPTGVSVEVACPAPELLAGAVALVVPTGSAAAGAVAVVPVVHREVPVLVDDSVSAPALAVPAHDGAAFELARRHGLVAIPVVGSTGAVDVPGPLAGVARYGARRAARQLLEAEGALVGAADWTERAGRCPACSTVVVPLLGSHWFLAGAELVGAATEAVRKGQVAVHPAGLVDEVLAGAERWAEWCLSQQLWGGVPLPVGRCLECLRIDVWVDPPESCGKCMGEVVPGTDVLDARFVRCVWPLAAGGWPDDVAAAGGRTRLLAAGPADILPMVALGLRLAGRVPFDEVAVVPGPGAGGRPPDPGALVANEERAVARLALFGTGRDVAACRRLARRLVTPPAGTANVDQLGAAVDAAYERGTPIEALALLAAAAKAGVPAEQASLIAGLAGPLLGN